MNTPAINRYTTYRITGAIFTSQSLFSAAYIAMYTLMAIVATDLSGDEKYAGLPATGIMLGRAAAAYPIGRLMDRIGRRLGLSIGYLISMSGAITSLFGIIQGSFGLFLVGATLLGMGRGAADQSRYIAAEVHALDRRAKAIGLIIFAGTIGAILGPQAVAYSGKLAEGLGVMVNAGPWILATGLLFLVFLVTFSLVYPDPATINRQIIAQHEATNPSAGVGDDTSGRSIAEIFAVPLVRLAIAAMVIGQLVMGLLMVITPLHLKHLNYTNDYIGWSITYHTVGMFAFSGVTGWLIDRFGRIPIIIGGGVLLIAATTSALFATSLPVIYTLMFLLGLGWNFCFVGGSSLLSDQLRASERGQMQGAGDMLVSLASGAASLLTGVIFAQYGFGSVGMVGLGFVLALLALLAWTMRTNQQQTVQVPVGD